MGLIQTARDDWQEFITDEEGFGVAINLVAPDLTSLDISGLHTKHHIGFDTDGNLVNSKNAHVSFPEKLLTDASYPVRNASGEVDLKGHLVNVADSTGGIKNYVIREWFPDETVGVIACILGDFE